MGFWKECLGRHLYTTLQEGTLDKRRMYADALKLLASFLFSSDRAVLQLLHVLDWRPVLQQLSPVTAQHHTSSNAAQQSSLLDDDSTLTKSAGAESTNSQQSGPRGTPELDAEAREWAAQLLLLVMQAYVIMADADLPDWISRLIKGAGSNDLIIGAPNNILLHTIERSMLDSCPGVLDSPQ